MTSPLFYLSSKAFICATLLFSAGCSAGNGDWPRLNAPLPKDSDRVLSTSKPSGINIPNSMARAGILSNEAVNSAYNALIPQVQKDKESYTAAKTALLKTDMSDDYAYPIAWQTAQMALTRLSSTNEDLITVHDSAKNPESAVAALIRRDVERMNELLSLERAFLTRKRPN